MTASARSHLLGTAAPIGAKTPLSLAEQNLNEYGIMKANCSGIFPGIWLPFIYPICVYVSIIKFWALSILYLEKLYFCQKLEYDGNRLLILLSIDKLDIQ